MTPEERFTKIENALTALTERQVQQEIVLERHDKQIDSLIATTEKNTAAIRDLIVISRTLLDSQKAMEARLDQLGVRLDQLTATVNQLSTTVDRLSANIDRFLKGLQRPNGHS